MCGSKFCVNGGGGTREKRTQNGQLNGLALRLRNVTCMWHGGHQKSLAIPVPKLHLRERIGLAGSVPKCPV
jgi:hypothetical protein